MNFDEDITLDDLSEEQRSVAELMGLDEYLRMVKLFGGEILYIPKSDFIARYARNRRIKLERAEGKSYKYLAKKYNLTKNTIKRILNSDTP